MLKIRILLRQFLQGRYGADALFYALMGLYLLLLVLRMAFRDVTGVGLVLGVLAWSAFIFAFYRVLSRDTFRRGQENAAFLRMVGRVRGRMEDAELRRSSGASSPVGGSGPSVGDKVRDFPKKKYITCPKCKASIRVPRQRGKHTVRCPRCGERFGVNILFGSK